MTARQYTVQPGFRHLIAYYWTLESDDSDAPTERYRLVPDGYTDWIFHLSHPWQYGYPKSSFQLYQHHAHVFGQIRHFAEVQLCGKPLRLFGVKFHPWAAHRLWQTDMNLLTDLPLPLSDLGLPQISLLVEQIVEEKTVTGRINRIEEYIIGLRPEQPDDSLCATIGQIAKTTSKLPPTGLPIQARRLEQRFQKEIGISPKRFQRTIRINRLITQLRNNPTASLTQLAYRFGFFDQSHFIRDFRQFTGMSPSRFIRSIRPSGDILNLRIA